jgi:CBS domain-containing protein
VKAGIPAKATLDRLAGAAAAGTLDASTANDLSEAFRFLWEVRLRHQADQVRRGEPPDDFVDPSTLGPVTRRGLKEAFGVIARSQRVLAADLGLRTP